MTLVREWEEASQVQGKPGEISLKYHPQICADIVAQGEKELAARPAIYGRIQRTLGLSAEIDTSSGLLGVVAGVLIGSGKAEVSAVIDRMVYGRLSV